MAAFLQIMRQTLVHGLHLTDAHGWHLGLWIVLPLLAATPTLHPHIVF